MAHFKLFLLSLLAVSAVCVAASASASAESCTGGSNLVFCHGNTPLVNEAVLGLAGTLVFASTVGGAEAKFSCPKGDFKATLEALGAFKGLLLSLGCKEEKPTSCKLTAADESEIDALFTGQQKSQTSALVTGSMAGEELVTLHVENKPGEICPQTGALVVTGKQVVETPNGSVSLLEQEIVAKKSGSFLKLGSASASLSFTIKDTHLGGANLGLFWLVANTGV